MDERWFYEIIIPSNKLSMKKNLVVEKVALLLKPESMFKGLPSVTKKSSTSWQAGEYRFLDSTCQLTQWQRKREKNCGLKTCFKCAGLLLLLYISPTASCLWVLTLLLYNVTIPTIHKILNTRHKIAKFNQKQKVG